MLGRNHIPIRHNVIDVVGAQRARKTEIVDLNRTRSMGKNALPGTTEIAIEIHQYVDLPLLHHRRRLEIAHPRDIDHFIEGLFDSAPKLAPVTPAVVKSDQLEAIPVMQLEQLRHQDGGRLGAKLARQITQTNLCVWVAFAVP